MAIPVPPKTAGQLGLIGDLNSVYTALRNELTTFNVKDYGAVGDGSADDTAAIQNAITACIAAGGGVVRLPIGRYLTTSQLNVGTGAAIIQGVRIVGESKFSTELVQSTAFASTSVIRFVNARYCTVENLYIHGNATTPVRAGIEFRRDNPSGPSVTSCVVKSVVMGTNTSGDNSTTIPRVVDGIRITHASGSDGNNDFHRFDDVTVKGFSGIAYNFESRQSVGNVLLGCKAEFGPTALALSGGAVDVTNMMLGELTSCEFDFRAPATTGTYGQGSTFVNIFTEYDLNTVVRAFRTTADTNIKIHVTNYHRFGSAPTIPIIDYQSNSHFTMINSDFNLGQTNQTATFSSASSVATFIGCALAFTTMTYAGKLRLIGNRYYTTPTLTPSGGSASLERVGEAVPGREGVWTSYTPVLGGTGATIGNGTIDGNYTRIGDTIHFNAFVALGSTSSMATSNETTISLPFAPAQDRIYNLRAVALDQGTSYVPLGVITNNTAVARLFTSTLLGFVNTTVPFTWAATDQIQLSGTYRAVAA